ncbi:hypothetical protein HGRIS_006158 [Hohenbuehelia grisea]
MDSEPMQQKRKRSLSVQILEDGDEPPAKKISASAASKPGVGRPPDEVMAQLMIKHSQPHPTKHGLTSVSWECVATDCTAIRQGNPCLNRALKHASSCRALARSHPSLYQLAINESSDNSLGATLTELRRKRISARSLGIWISNSF